MTIPSNQSHTPAYPRPSKAELRSLFVGKTLSDLRTPTAIVDVARVERNCVRMLELAQRWGVPFRAHIKTHKTLEGSLKMLSPQGQTLTTSRAIAATLPEAWGLIEEGCAVDPKDVELMKRTLSDVLYSLPLPLDKIDELAQYRTALRRYSSVGDSAQLRLMVDNISQAQALQQYAEQHNQDPFSIFIKIECGYKRAGIQPHSQYLRKLLLTIRDSCPLVSIYGFYTHAGHSYGSRSVDDAEVKLNDEINAADEAAVVAQEVLGPDVASRHEKPFVLSVGSTPTAHAAHQFVQSKQALSQLKGGQVELHAGNYLFLDLQQVATRALAAQDEESCCVQEVETNNVSNVAFSVLSTVIAEYPARGTEAGAESGDGTWSEDGQARRGDEGMCDAGGIALSKDAGPFGGLGHVIEPKEKYGWEINRASQEHGLLALRSGEPVRWASEWSHSSRPAGYPERLHLGEKIRILPQHACLTAAQHPWYYVVDSNDASKGTVIVDVWVPWKFW